MHNSIHSQYFDIQKSFSEGKISFEKYSSDITKWSNEFSDLIKAQKVEVDGSKGGKLIKKKVVDKTGKEVTKWVKRDQQQNDREITQKNNNQEFEIPVSVWQANAESADEKSLQRASIYAKSEEVRRIARNELFKRKFDLKKFLDMSLMPDFLLDDYVNRYKYDLNNSEKKSITEYRSNTYFKLNDKIRTDEELSEEEYQTKKDLDNVLNRSELLNDVVLFRGLSGKKSLMFVNYLKSLEPGDVFEEKGYSSTTLLEGVSEKFKNLHGSVNNITLKVYASKGQKALCMQNLGSEDNKTTHKGEYEFLLPTNSRFQVISLESDTLSVKLI